MERRKHRRFSATAFLNKPVRLTPVPPYFGKPVDGKLIDLSAGGMAMAISQLIPKDTKLSMIMTFPDGSTLNCDVEVVHVMPKDRLFIHGLMFLNLSPEMSAWIESLSNDYLNCESRIQSAAENVCTRDCSFFKMCVKPEKLDPLPESTVALYLQFEKKL